MNIVFCIKELAGIAGGAERVLADIANGLANRGHRVHVLSFDEEGQAPFYNFYAVTFVPLGDLGRSILRFQNLRLKKRAMQLEPDVIYGFLPSTYIFLSILFY